MNKKTAVCLRTTTSIGERFCDALDWLVVQDATLISAADVRLVNEVVVRLRDRAGQVGYSGKRGAMV